MTKSKPRYAVKTQHGYISKRGTTNPKPVKKIDQARLYLRPGDAWSMARKWDKSYEHNYRAPFRMHAFVVEVHLTEGAQLQDPKLKA